MDFLTIILIVFAVALGYFIGRILRDKYWEEQILEERKVDIDKKKIELAEHIKEVGEYDVEVKLYKDVKAEIKIVVLSEDIIVEDKDQSTEESQSNDNIDSENK